VVTLKAVGTCRLSVSIADDGTYAAATNTYIFTVTKASPAITFELSGGISSLTYRTPTTITLFSATAGKISLKANGKAVSGCVNLAITTSRSCIVKASSHGQVALQVIFTPTNTANYSVTSTSNVNIPVKNRITPR
jgi:DNA-binding protein